MSNPALPDPGTMQRACAPDCPGQGAVHDGAAHPVQAALTQFGESAHHLAHIVRLDLERAVQATRPLTEACALCLRHTTPETAHRLGEVARHWFGTSSVQHVLIGGAVLVLLGLLVIKPRPSRSRSAVDGVPASRRRASGAWRAAALGAAGGAALAKSAAFADDDQNFGDDAHPGHAFGHSIIGSSGADDFLFSDHSSSLCAGACTNPATGLPMVGDGCGGIDIMGNPYGTDLHDSFGSSWSDDNFSNATSWSSDDSWSSASSTDDSWSSSSSSWD